MEEDITNRFTRDTYPNLFTHPSFGTEYHRAREVSFTPIKEITPARDSRYPARAAAVEDGRLVTDYRPQCSKNIQAGQQFYTKLWMINHGNELVEESRKRQAEWSGASLPMSNTVPPPAAVVQSTPFYSEVNPTNLMGGVGVERGGASAPPMFGVFTYEPSISEMQANRKNIAVTSREEGGRNSRRGKF
jgi:hypothetical protein